jgi:hypothetical protein
MFAPTSTKVLPRTSLPTVERTASARLRTFISPRPDLITSDGDVPVDGAQNVATVLVSTAINE